MFPVYANKKFCVYTFDRIFFIVNKFLLAHSMYLKNLNKHYLI